jgi:hypothetical protein
MRDLKTSRSSAEASTAGQKLGIRWKRPKDRGERLKDKERTNSPLGPFEPLQPGSFTKPDLGAGKAAGAKTYSCTSSADNAASVKSRRAQRVRDFALRIGVLLKTECPS